MLKVEPKQSILQLAPYQPGKPIAELQREQGIANVVKLASNENPFGPAPEVIAALQTAAIELNYYPDGSGFELKEKLASYKKVFPNQIVLGNGSDEIFTLILTAFCTPGNSSVLISEYSFAAYAIAARSLGLNLQVVPTCRMQQDLAAMLAHIDKTTKVIFLANPNNPTGSWHNFDELQTWLQNIPENIIVVIDQAYFDYMQGVSNFTDAAQLLKKHQNLIVTYTFSKAYGLAGLRLGYALCHFEIAEVLNRPRLPFNVNSMAQVAGIAALAETKHMAKTLTNNRQGMELYMKVLAGFELEFLPPAGNFITVKVDNSMEVYNHLLTKGVIVRTLLPYNMPEYVRISIGLPEDNNLCLEHLIEFLDK